MKSASGSGRRGPRPWILVVLVIVVAAVILAAAVGTVYTPLLGPPQQISILAQGQFTLPVALTTLSTANNVSWANVTSGASLDLASSSTAGNAIFDFAWALASNASLPVEFTMDIPSMDSPFFAAQVGGAFSYLPMGACNSPCTRVGLETREARPGETSVYGANWTFAYTVRLMNRPGLLGSTRFLEVDLSPAGYSSAEILPLDYLGVAPPTSADMQPVQTFNIQGGPTAVFTTNDTAFQGKTFGYSPPAVNVSAGSEGTLSLRLSSSFRWSPSLWETVSFMGNGGNFSLREYIDLRFGSIVLAVGPWSGI